MGIEILTGLIYAGWGVSLFGIFLIFGFNICVALGASLRKSKRVDGDPSHTPFVSLVVVARATEDIIARKISNMQSMDYPADRYEVILFLDGAPPGSEDRLRRLGGTNLKCISSAEHHGKNHAINEAVKICRGEILVFSDVEALFGPGTVRQLVQNFSDPAIGGVCARIQYQSGQNKLGKAQALFLGFDRTIKRLESRMGSISSNNGSLYAIRANLFQPIPLTVTDDLFICLGVIKQGGRFIFDPAAVVKIPTRARSPEHEIIRRRRIVCSSLTGLRIHGELLNPGKYGFFSISLLVNKVIRRLLPVLLIILFFSSACLSLLSFKMAVFWALQAAVYGLAIAGARYGDRLRHVPVLGKAGSVAYYFCLGNMGTLRGLMDFMGGKKVSKWDPYGSKST